MSVSVFALLLLWASFVAGTVVLTSGTVDGCSVSGNRLLCTDGGMEDPEAYVFPAVEEFYQYAEGWSPVLSQLLDVLPRLKVSSAEC